MEQNINVSIGGIAFILDTQAYKILKDYTVRIEVGYRENPDGAEILSDIEARISELILSHQTAEETVHADLIQSIIEQLGLPDDLSSQSAINNSDEEDIQLPNGFAKRMYRNPDGAKLGGVCSGLGAYFNIDPVLIRFLFFVPLLLTPVFGIFHMGRMAGFSGTMIGVAFMLYIILWIVIPKAKTPLQKLEMKGKKITASSIERNFYDDFSANSVPPHKSEQSASILAEVISVIGRILLFCLKAFLLLIGVIFGIVAIAVIIAIIAALAGGYTALVAVGGALALSAGQYSILIILAGLTIILPLLILGYILLRLVFDLPAQKKTIAIISGIWILILIFMSIFIVRNIESIRQDWPTFSNKTILFNNITGRENNQYKRQIIITNDSTYTEKIQIGDSIVTDTVIKEYFVQPQ